MTGQGAGWLWPAPLSTTFGARCGAAITDLGWLSAGLKDVWGGAGLFYKASLALAALLHLLGLGVATGWDWGCHRTREWLRSVGQEL